MELWKQINEFPGTGIGWETRPMVPRSACNDNAYGPDKNPPRYVQFNNPKQKSQTAWQHYGVTLPNL